MDRGESLWHIEAIRQLKARYFRCLDSKDWEGYAKVFTDDAKLDVSDDTAIAAAFASVSVADLQQTMADVIGGRKIAEFVSTSIAGARTVHHGHTSEIEIVAPDEATGIWAMADIVEQANSMLRGEGHYRERYRQVDGEWRIAALRLTRLRIMFYRPDGEGGWHEVPAPTQASDLHAAVRPLISPPTG